MNSSSIISIKDLKPYNKDIHVKFQVIEQISKKKIQKGPNVTHNVANFKVADDTGTIQLTVWNEEIDVLKIGQNFELTNGYVNVFQNHAQLSSGRSGEIKSSEVKFDKINQENDISEKRQKSQDRRTPTRSHGRRKDKHSDKEDDFSPKVNKKFLWAEMR